MELSNVFKIKSLINKLKLNGFVKKASNVFIRRAIGLGLSFIWIFLITNLFGSDVYGIFSLAQVIVSFLAMLIGLGLDTAIIRLGADLTHFEKGVFKSDFYKKVIIAIVISSVYVSLLLLFLRYKIAEVIFKEEKLIDYLVFISFLIIFFVLHKVLVGFLIIQGKFKDYGNFFYIIPNLLMLAFIICIYKLRLPDSWLIIGYLLAYGILGLYLFFSFKKIPVNISEKICYPDILKLSIPIMLSSAFLFVSNWTDTFMLGAMVSKGELGIYNAAYKMATVILIVILAVNTVLAPKISQLFSLNKIKEIGLEVQKATKIITYLTIPIVLIILVFGEQLLSLYGNNFTNGKTTLFIIAFGFLFNALSGSVGQVLNMTDKQNKLRDYTFISAICNVVLNFFLIKDYGINGAAFASLMANVIFNTLAIIHIKKNFGFYTFLKI